MFGYVLFILVTSFRRKEDEKTLAHIQAMTIFKSTKYALAKTLIVKLTILPEVENALKSVLQYFLDTRS